MAVHFCGYPADLGPLRELCDAHGIALVEDAAQAIGAEAEPGRQAGTVGRLGCLSFFSKKQLCVGEGGAVLTADEELAARVRSLRSHAMTSGTWDRHPGHEASYDVVDVGYNFRLDEPRAALGLARLPRLRDDIERRRAAVRRYRERARRHARADAHVDGRGRRAQLALRVPGAVRERGGACARARRARRAGDPDDPLPGAAQPHRARAAGRGGIVPAAEAAADRHLALPLSSDQSDASVDTVVAAVRGALRQP